MSAHSVQLVTSRRLCLLALRRDFLIIWGSSLDLLAGCSRSLLHLPFCDPATGLLACRILVDKVVKHAVGLLNIV